MCRRRDLLGGDPKNLDAIINRFVFIGIAIGIGNLFGRRAVFARPAALAASMSRVLTSATFAGCAISFILCALGSISGWPEIVTRNNLSHHGQDWLLTDKGQPFERVSEIIFLRLTRT
ncbi:MAG: hypothetical protein CK529_06875 [Rhodospirillaceae bacterium]|nr:MAG: hypothetical protein CK529_06875 [Rhodospirillaceae bacterium]